MDILTLILIVAAAVLIAVLIAVPLVFFITLGLFVNAVMYGRQEQRSDYKYFTPQDFSLQTSPINVVYRKTRLSAFVYSVKPASECEKVLIFAHGYGAGTASYMTEIAYFARKGYAVVAADNYGCNYSEGKNCIGLYAGAEAVIAAYIGVKSEESLKNKPVVLVGHSWGAYSVLCASAKVKAEKVVALSAFDAPAKCTSDVLKGYLTKRAKWLAVLLRSSIYVANFFRFGAKGNTRASKAVAKSGAPALLIHGEKDAMVPLKNSAAAKATSSNVQKLILSDKRHNPYNTVAAENKLAELLGADFNSEEEEAAFLKTFDWSAATEEDAEVMQTICDFIEK